MKLLRAVAAKTFRHMVRNGVSPANVNNYNVIIRGFATGNIESEPKKKVGDAFGSPDSVSFNAAIQELCRKSSLKEAEEMLEDMSRKGLAPDERTYTSLIIMYCRQLQGSKAYKVLNQIIVDPLMLIRRITCTRRWCIMVLLLICSLYLLLLKLYHDGRHNEMHWVIQNTLRSCNLNDSELLKVLDEIDVRKCEIHALRYVLAVIAVDSLLLDGGKCSYAASLPPP